MRSASRGAKGHVAYTGGGARISILSLDAYPCGYGLRPRTTKGLQEVYGALDTSAAPVQDVGVDHGRLHALVAEEFLDRPDIVAVHQEVGGEGVAQVWQVAGLARPAARTAWWQGTPLADPKPQGGPAPPWDTTAPPAPPPPTM